MSRVGLLMLLRRRLGTRRDISETLSTCNIRLCCRLISIDMNKSYRCKYKDVGFDYVEYMGNRRCGLQIPRLSDEYEWIVYHRGIVTMISDVSTLFVDSRVYVTIIEEGRLCRVIINDGDYYEMLVFPDSFAHTVITAPIMKNNWKTISFKFQPPYTAMNVFNQALRALGRI